MTKLSHSCGSEAPRLQTKPSCRVGVDLAGFPFHSIGDLIDLPMTVRVYKEKHGNPIFSLQAANRVSNF